MIIVNGFSFFSFFSVLSVVMCCLRCVLSWSGSGFWWSFMFLLYVFLSSIMFFLRSGVLIGLCCGSFLMNVVGWLRLRWSFLSC